ncbi:HPr kinase/phosphorylase [Pseudoruegeria aquimaris]|nr:hypothetical protein [Pseudoruegeria aquimaris]
MTEADRTLQSRLQRALDTGAPVHASAVALHGRALLILGRSGSGKSTLALQLMAHGAGLLADDGALLAAEAGGIRIGCPAAIRGRIEARGLGLLEAPAAAPARLHAVVDLDAIEADRLPEPRALTLSGHSVSLFSKVDGPHFAPALLLVLRAAGAGEKENAQ